VRFSVIGLLVCGFGVLAQQPPTQIRKPPTKMKKPPTPEPDITAQIDGSLAITGGIRLSESAEQGLDLSKKNQAETPAPIESSDGRLVYEYGPGVPTVVCSTLQICEIDLEPGEMLKKDALDLGDTVRFKVTTRVAGSGPAEFNYLVVKPDTAEIDTTMVVGTNKRVYYIRLVATERGHMTRVAFRYPAEEEAALQAAEVAVRLQEEIERGRALHLKELDTSGPLRNHNYKIVAVHGRDLEWLKPQRIADDGVRTHITLSAEARHRGLPVVQIQDARGTVPANERWEGDELVIDALFERACLLDGVGKSQQRVCIQNEELNATAR
jgi:type IV secretion system protein TrbG